MDSSPITIQLEATQIQNTDPFATLMAHNLASGSLAGQFSNLGSMLLGRFTTTSSDYSQAQTLLSAGADGSIVPASSVAQGDIDLTVTTASGIKVDIQLESGNGQLGVSIKSSGKLNTAESDAIAKLANGFQQAINGLDSVPPTLNLSGLSQYDTSMLSSVNMQFNLGDVSGSFTSNASYQSVSLKDGEGSMNLKVNNGQSALLGSGAQRAQAIASYLKEFDAANSKGHGNADMMALFDSAFTQLNGGGETSQQSSSSTSAIGATSGSSGQSWLAQAEESMLTGLNDFTGSVTDTTSGTVGSAPGSFSYQVSQTTSVEGTSQNGSISQTQESDLKATYQQAESASDSGDYDDVTIDDSASSTVRIATQDGELVKATLDKKSSDSTTNAEYQDGKLVSDVTTPTDTSTSTDLLKVLNPLIANGDATKDSSAWQQTLASIQAMILPDASAV
jgi:hypothetical protein